MVFIITKGTGYKLAKNTCFGVFNCCWLLLLIGLDEDSYCVCSLFNIYCKICFQCKFILNMHIIETFLTY